jgi:2,4-dienoyl-CoA reductase-like NADH-dependent reductase (Old Yellow Enzyme family)
VARAAKSEGSLIIGQLNHPGRQVSINIQPYPEAPSDVEQPSTGGILYGRPTPLTIDGIKDIVQRFAYVASVLHRAGFDGIQVKFRVRHRVSISLNSDSAPCRSRLPSVAIFSQKYKHAPR